MFLRPRAAHYLILPVIMTTGSDDFFDSRGLLRNSAATLWANDLLMSLRLNPRDPTSALAASVLAVSWYFEGNYTAAAETAARCLADHPAHPGPRRFLAAALGQLGRRAEAASVLRDFMDNAPQVFDSLVRQRALFVRPEDHEHMLDGLRKAGWQG
jgi:hypothetical protein